MNDSTPTEAGSKGRETIQDVILSRLREAAALDLWRLGAVKVSQAEPFRLASGKPSPIYVNCRRVISEPSFLALFQAASARLMEARQVQVEALAGGETAGIPFAAILASSLNLPMTYVRKQAKGYGLANRVEGQLQPGQRVLLVEDLITDGGSKVGFLDALCATGAEVTEALVLFDREQGGAALLAGQGVRLHSVTGIGITLEVGQAEGFLDDATRQSVQSYLADADAWAQERGL